MGRVNLLQSKPQLPPVTPNVNVEPHVRIVILDISHAPQIGMHSRFVALELKVSRVWLESKDEICCQYCQGLSFLIRKYLVIFVADIIARM